MELKTNAAQELKTACEVSGVFAEIEEKAERIKTTLGFYTPKQVREITGWSMNTVYELFNDLEFPACDYGSRKLVPIPAFWKYFDQRRNRSDLEKRLKHVGN